MGGTDFKFGKANQSIYKYRPVVGIPRSPKHLGMALTHFASSFCTLPALASPSRALGGPVSSKNYRCLPTKVRCMVATEAAGQIVRRSANYQTSIWEYDYVQSLTSKYKV
jgi:hypothetical protein